MIKRLKNLKVLIAEDEADLLDILKEEFELMGATVVGAKDGAQALHIVKNGKVDIVVSDVRMPGGDGITLFNNISKLKNKPLFYFCSAFNDITDDEAKSKGARALFKKPFDLDKLINLMQSDIKSVSDS